MPSDELTKHLSNNVLTMVAQRGRWCIVETEEVRSAREAMQGKRREYRHRAKARLDSTPLDERAQMRAPATADECSPLQTRQS